MEHLVNIEYLKSKYPDVAKYLTSASMAIMQATVSCDYAVSAEKMMDWNNVGEESEAWKAGPYLTSPANKKDINRAHPYVLMISKETSVVTKIVIGSRGGDNGNKIPLPFTDDIMYRSEFVISRMAIIEQFEIYKRQAIISGWVFNKKKIEDIDSNVPLWVSKCLEDIIDRRNSLVHDDSFEAPTIREAVDRFYELIHIAIEFNKVFAHN